MAADVALETYALARHTAETLDTLAASLLSLRELMATGIQIASLPEIPPPPAPIVNVEVPEAPVLDPEVLGAAIASRLGDLLTMRPEDPTGAFQVTLLERMLAELALIPKHNTVIRPEGKITLLNPSGQVISPALEPSGTFNYDFGTAGTVTPVSGAKVRGIFAHATTAGSINIFSKGAIPIPANTVFFDTPELLTGDGTSTIVLTGTDSYYVRYL